MSCFRANSIVAHEKMDIRSPKLHNIPHAFEELACRDPEWRQYLRNLRMEQGDSDGLEIEDYWKRGSPHDQTSRDHRLRDGSILKNW